MATARIDRRRRNSELTLGLLAVVLTAAGCGFVIGTRDPKLYTISLPPRFLRPPVP